MDFLKLINDYAQLINFALFVTIIGWLIKISSISRVALQDKQKAVLAEKDTKIAELNQASNILQLQLTLTEKERDKCLLEQNNNKVDPKEVLATLELVEKKSSLQVKEYEQEINKLISTSQLKEKEIENLKIINNKLKKGFAETENTLASTLVLNAQYVHRYVHTNVDRIHYLRQLISTNEMSEDKIFLVINELEEEIKGIKLRSGLKENNFFDNSKKAFVSLQKIINDALQFVNKQIYDKNIEVELIGLESLPKINVDEPIFKHAILNLLMNAIKHSEDSGKIILIGKKKSKTIELKIQDFGRGVLEDLKETIFDPFITTDPNSSGLGLSIAKRVMVLNDGNLVLSKLKMPTEFTITLPIQNHVE